MKKFYETNTITYNLMSFSAFKAILIFSACLEGPKSYEDLQQIIENHPYLRETVSVDTIRIYINSLKKMGCKINKITKNRIAKYYVEEHPFNLKINDAQVKSIIKVFNAISKSIEIEDFLTLTKFFEKFSMYVTNENLKDELKNISPLKNVDMQLVEDLKKYVQNNAEITVLYNSRNSGVQNINILADRLFIENGEIYISGHNSKYNNYAKFPLTKIEKITGVNLKKPILSVPEIRVVYEYYKHDNMSFDLLPNEKIIKETKNKLLIEIVSKNKFDITQRILFHTNKCKVISPANFKEEIVACLREMKEGYFDK